MNTLDGARLSSQAIGYLVLGLSLLGGVLWAVWALDRQAVRRARQAAEALNAVMAATVLRRNLSESMGLILTQTVESLQAVSGTLHLAEAEGHALRLVYSVGVEHLDWLAQVSPDDPLLQRLTISPKEILLAPLDLNSRWVALATDLLLTLVVMRLGERTKR